jgi:hypothetical protein
LDPEIWQLRIHLDGVDNLERTLARDDITYMNILALIETQGYSMRDSIYCVKEDGKGLEGMELMENNEQIYELLAQFESTKVLKLHVQRGRPPCAKKVIAENLAGQQHGSCLINYQDAVVYDLSPPVVYAVDDDGQVFESQVESNNPYMCTQESNNFSKAKPIVLDEEDDSDHSDSSYDSVDIDTGVTDFGHIEEMRKKEERYVAEKIAEMRRKRLDPLLCCEGDSDIEDIFVAAEDKEIELEPVPKTDKKKKLPVRRGPTTRAHASVKIDRKPDYKPSSDEDSDPGFLRDSDDDGFEPISMVPPKGRKSRAKKQPERKWYDERRLQAHEQLCLKMCFRDAQQFRDALIDLHVAQSRNYGYHRNSDKRIIVHCIENDCPFYMTGSEIKGENTFVLRKMWLDHTCATTTESSRVSAKWLARTYENLFKSDPNTNIQTLIDNAREQYGVEVPRMMAYRAKNLALDAVLGDHREQYFRLRDYAQTVVDTNPGSRVIVATVTPAPTVENPQPGPHFHGLFFCINGPREGFLKGCRPFIGLDGCFIKLCTGAQILAATGRDGNNNMYPIAFAIVEKEDKANWCWFLTQLKYALGGDEGEFGTYTIMSDRQKVTLSIFSCIFLKVISSTVK